MTEEERAIAAAQREYKKLKAILEDMPHDPRKLPETVKGIIIVLFEDETNLRGLCIGKFQFKLAAHYLDALEILNNPQRLEKPKIAS